MRSASKLIVLTVFIAACGERPSAGPVVTAGPPAPPAPAPVIRSASSAPPSAPPGRLGHYSSGDGSVGFILDRMGPTPKMRMDGATEIVDFEPDGKTLDHVDFVNHVAHAFFRFESNGRVTFVRGAASIVVARDAGAESLRGGLGNVKTFPESPESGDPNSAKLRLGHYSSGDGMTGFVLDRMGPKPRLRLDDAHEILVLETEPANLDDKSLTIPGRGVALRVGSRGQVQYFRGNESIAMHRDCDADPLR